MRRTLLAVGIAVLLSAMATPWQARSYDTWNCWLVHHQCRYQPFFLLDARDRNWPELGLQTVFLAVLAAVLVNLSKPPSQINIQPARRGKIMPMVAR
jgi:hypothetical protein